MGRALVRTDNKPNLNHSQTSAQQKRQWKVTQLKQKLSVTVRIDGQAEKYCLGAQGENGLGRYLYYDKA